MPSWPRSTLSVRGALMAAPVVCEARTVPFHARWTRKLFAYSIVYVALLFGLFAISPFLP